MTTLIDTLVVALGFDTSGLAKGQKEASDSFKKTSDAASHLQKDVEEGAKRMAEGYQKLLDGVMAVTAAIVGLVAGKDVIEHLTKQDAALARSSKFMNTSTQDLQNWQGAAVQTGDTADGMQGAFQTVSSEMQKMALTGKSDMIPFLTQAHVDLGKFFNAATPLPEKLKLIQDAMAGMDPAKAKALLEGMGLGGAENSLTTQRAAFEKLLEVQQKLNAHTKEDDAAAIRRSQAWQLVEAALEGVGRKITTFVSPAIEGLLNFISAHAPASISLILAMGSAVGALTALKFGGILGNLAKLGGAFEAAAGSAALLTGIAGTLGVIGAGLGGFALGTLIEDKTGIGSKFGSWVADLFDHNDYTSANPHVYGANKPAAGATDYSSLEAAAGLPAGLLSAIKREETGTGSGIGAVSPKGARGPFQFMPATAAQYGVTNPDDPQQAAQGAAKYLAYLLKLFKGNLPMAVAAYNEGEGAAARGAMPFETQKYVSDVMSRIGPAASGGGGTTHVAIDQVHVHTTASTMSGAGKDFGESLRRHVAAQSNTGIE